MSISTIIPTSDKLIRRALIKNLKNLHKNDYHYKIIEELGVVNGSAKVDIAVVNGIMHGYELKSDLDTLYRLPEQMKHYNSVFDQVTLVVGKNHAHEAIKIIPEWWGITIAKITDESETVSFYKIREPEQNPEQNKIQVASMLWRSEALSLLEKMNAAKGVRSKCKETIYERLAKVLDEKTLKDKIRESLCSRTVWRPALMCTPSGD